MEEEITESQLEKALGADLQIGGVQVLGSKRTRPDFLEWILRLSGEGDTFGSILEKLSEVIEAVKQTDTFESVEAYLEESEEKGKTDVIFSVEEKQRTSITVGTESGGSFGDTTVGGSFHIRNVFGRLETLRANAGASPTSMTSSASSSIGSKNYFALEFTKPFLFDLASSLGFRLYSTEEKLSYTVDKYGADVILSLPLLTLSYEASWRNVGQAPNSSGAKIREQCGHSFKSAVTAASVIDLRDNPLSPNFGLFSSVKAELAGLFGDARHFLHEYEGQLHLPLGQSGLVFNSCAKMGMINRLPRGGPVHVIDRFIVGGPASMRGFRSRGVGEHDGRDPLGAEFYTTMFMGLAIPIGMSGLLRTVLAKAHVWGMVGDVNSLESLTPKVLKPTSWFESTRASVGVGITAALPIGRLELNWCHVVRSSGSDREKNGLQIGLTQSFS
ncbi:hypothetical protein NDN08_007410 [Rhodosorus marinus]|uniref:Bacterial surface antigen (D15) domain-containing protein n=1 Tax=Rhodosorus marinus TaxID=101924 RepID=A0AAV8UXG6_9RHOD|nr:hypothetical protein NDN08_007410 [Rhodosorus marinus]